MTTPVGAVALLGGIVVAPRSDPGENPRSFGPDSGGTSVSHAPWRRCLGSVFPFRVGWLPVDGGQRLLLAPSSVNVDLMFRAL